MKVNESLNLWWRRISHLRKEAAWRHKYHYQKIEHRARRHGKRSVDPAHDILLIADIRPADRVLDMGCAEGHITLEVAKRVAHVDGVEIEPARVQEARRFAVESGATNVSFFLGSVVDFPLEPLSYDLTLFLGVLDKRVNAQHVGLTELRRLLVATKRQIIIRFGVEKVSSGIPLADILRSLDELGFDGICFSRREDFFGNLIVGHRRGAGARLGKVPPFILVPTETMRSHPCISDAIIGRYNEFS
jgi:SAM-dependent methyltransferase